MVNFFYENFLGIVLGFFFIRYYMRRTSKKLPANSPLGQLEQKPIQGQKLYVQEEAVEAGTLSFDDRCALLASYKFADTQIIPMIARFMVHATKEECLLFLENAQKLVHKDRNFMTFQDFMTSYLDVIHGPLQESFTQPDAERKKIAFHESAHAIGYIYQSSDCIVHVISIESRQEVTGFIIYLPIEESTDLLPVDITWVEHKVIIGLAGAVAEQVFGLPDGQIIDKETGFDDLLFRIMFQSDFEKVRDHIMAIMTLQKHHLAKILNKESFTDQESDQINDAIEEIMKIYYAQTYDFVVKHKDKVEILAHALLKKETLYADQIYEVLGVVRPRYDFES